MNWQPIIDLLVIAAVVFGVAGALLWYFWEDKTGVCWEDKLSTKPVFPPICKAAHVPAQHAPQFKKPLQEVKTAFHHAALEPEIKVTTKPHPKPRKH